MPFSVSNIGLPPHGCEPRFDKVKELGFDGVEVAPSRVWCDTWKGLRAADVERYRQQIEAAGLKVVGLHSLFFDQPDLTIFGDDHTRARSVEFLAHLSTVCRDLGGKTLIFGSPNARRRGPMTKPQALDLAARTFDELSAKTQGHGTLFCMEPLGPTETDFCNTIAEIEDLYARIDTDIVRFQIDVRALSANGEVVSSVFEKVKSLLAHVHVNAADLGALRTDDGVEHKMAGNFLKQIKYASFLSLEQRSVDESDYWTPLAQSMKIMKEFYA